MIRADISRTLTSLHQISARTGGEAYLSSNHTFRRYQKSNGHFVIQLFFSGCKRMQDEDSLSSTFGGLGFDIGYLALLYPPGIQYCEDEQTTSF